MIQEIWKLFPRIIEEKIASLLDEAEPNRMKAYQLYKSCQNENLWKNTFTEFSDYLNEFYSLPKSERSKSRFDFYLERPMHRSVFADFQLDFRNASVNNSSLLNVASWAHNMMRINCKTSSLVISNSVITKTLNYITNPPPFEKAQDIDFEDFCTAWKRTVFGLFGKKYNTELQQILDELHLLNIDQKTLERTQRFIPLIYLTQTEIDWTLSVQKAAEDYQPLPNFPLSRGAQKQRLIELERTAQLYTIVFNSEREELLAHRENVRATILDRCQSLMRDCAK